MLARIDFASVDLSRDGARNLELARSWRSNNAEILAESGDYYRRHYRDGASGRESLIKSDNLFREAIKNQPSSAKYWANFAYTKANLNEFDQEFYHAYKIAFDYGGREYHINQLLGEIGFAYWDLIKSEHRSMVKKSVIHLYESDVTETLNFSDRYGKLKMVCIWINNEGKQNRRCDRALSKIKKRVSRSNK